MEVTEGYEARGVPDTSATDGDDRDDGATDLASYERAASMAELLARLGESQEVQAIGARAGARSGAASHLMLGRQHRERVRRGQAGPEWGVQWGLHSDSSGLGWGGSRGSFQGGRRGTWGLQPLACRRRRGSREALGELQPIEEGEGRGGCKGWSCMGFEKNEAKYQPTKIKGRNGCFIAPSERPGGRNPPVVPRAYSLSAVRARKSSAN